MHTKNYMGRSEKNFEEIAISEANIAESLALLCKKLIFRLAQYTDMDEEEKRLQKILEEGENGLGDGDNCADNIWRSNRRG
jgi:hypothetical protein